MKALTLHQPWASLVAMGVKRIETRSWSTSYRGRLYIHAGAKSCRRLTVHPEGMIGAWWVVDRDGEPYLLDHRVGHGTDADLHELPLGAVVATCELVDVVPIGPDGKSPRIKDFPHEGGLPHQQGGLWLYGYSEWNRGTPIRLEDQRPYGDFTPGRFAWLLGDIKPVDPPVPCKGRQGLWEWTQ